MVLVGAALKPFKLPSPRRIPLSMARAKRRAALWRRKSRSGRIVSSSSSLARCVVAINLLGEKVTAEIVFCRVVGTRVASDML